MAGRSPKNPTREPAVASSDENVLLSAAETDWFADSQYDGQLAVDVFQTPTTVVIRAAIAGVEPGDLDIAVHRDVVTIRGKRKQEERIAENDYLFQECYWGSFSRSILLPIEVDADGAEAKLRSGILTVTLPKAERSGARAIRVESEESDEA